MKAVKRMSEWKTIDSAPKDGTNIIGYGPIRQSKFLREEGRGGYWGKETTEPQIRQIYMAARLWQTNGFGHMLATHWMPLPEPPNDPQ